MNEYLLLLAIFPLSVYYLSDLYKPSWQLRLTGIAFGLVVAPVSLCLLQYVYVPVVGKIFGFIGLIMNLIHGSVGYFMVVGMGFQEPGVLLSSVDLTTINLINATIWAVYYGILGYHFDLKGAEQERFAIPQR